MTVSIPVSTADQSVSGPMDSIGAACTPAGKFVEASAIQTEPRTLKAFSSSFSQRERPTKPVAPVTKTFCLYEFSRLNELDLSGYLGGYFYHPPFQLGNQHIPGEIRCIILITALTHLFPLR